VLIEETPGTPYTGQEQRVAEVIANGRRSSNEPRKLSCPACSPPPAGAMMGATKQAAQTIIPVIT
jgi:hypothetical protein